MNKVVRFIIAWPIAVLVTLCLAVIFQTQNVIANLNDLGGNIGFGDRLSMTFYDLQHLGSLYGIFIALALLIAFLAGALVFKFAKFGRPVIYIMAGAIAIFVMLFAMKAQFFDIHIIAGAKDGFGIVLQMLAGAIGGFIFSKISRPTLGPDL